MAIDAGTAALVGVGGTTLAALLGVVANLRNTQVNRAQLVRQERVDGADEIDRAYLRLEKENARLSAALDEERTAHQGTRDELLRCREEAAQLRAENTVLTVGLAAPKPPRKQARGRGTA